MDTLEDLRLEEWDKKWPGPRSATWDRRKKFMEDIRREVVQGIILGIGKVEDFKGCDGYFAAKTIVEGIKKIG